ncbi:MAG: pyridoxine 5'-phosphate synthase [Proteobacteria bacterium]|nr:pyridoxine 5'-phosphate synthase [Pseudomonadota bacterium]
MAQSSHDSGRLRLGVNIDHVATIRNARGASHPDPVNAALVAEHAGADGITAHLREDRRHIREPDLAAIKAKVTLPLNLEMAATEAMRDIALATQPNAACIVPENRMEITTEGGLDVVGQRRRLAPIMAALKDQGIRLSLFVEADQDQLHAAADLGADIVELHTGRYCDLPAGDDHDAELHRIIAAAKMTEQLGLECHAGHGLRFDNVGPIAAIPQVIELNIGHFLIGDAIMSGLSNAIMTMRRLIDEARSS